MEPSRIKNLKRGPERVIQDNIIEFLTIRGWYVKETHGNMYQSGFPDLWAAHLKYGQRWIEVKNRTSYRFTPAQVESFPKMNAHGVGVWIMTDATESEYDKLFKPHNWYSYLGTPEIYR